MFFNFPQSSPQNVVTQLEVKCLKDFYLTGTNSILQMEKKKTRHCKGSSCISETCNITQEFLLTRSVYLEMESAQLYSLHSNKIQPKQNEIIRQRMKAFLAAGWRSDCGSVTDQNPHW